MVGTVLHNGPEKRPKFYHDFSTTKWVFMVVLPRMIFLQEGIFTVLNFKSLLPFIKITKSKQLNGVRKHFHCDVTLITNQRFTQILGPAIPITD